MMCEVRIELETAAELPTFFDELVAAGEGALAPSEQRRLVRASDAAKVAVDLYSTWIESTLADGVDDWPIGRERHDAMVGLRAFDGLTSDDIAVTVVVSGISCNARAVRSSDFAWPQPTLKVVAYQDAADR